MLRRIVPGRQRWRSRPRDASLTSALPQGLDKSRFRHGRCQQKTLPIVTTHGLQRTQVVRSLNALRASEASKSVGQVHDGLAQSRIALIPSTICGERRVDLQFRNWQGLYPCQRRICMTEIVNRQQHAIQLELSSDFESEDGIIQDLIFCHLENEPW